MVFVFGFSKLVFTLTLGFGCKGWLGGGGCFPPPPILKLFPPQKNRVPNRCPQKPILGKRNQGGGAYRFFPKQKPQKNPKQTLWGPRGGPPVVVLKTHTPPHTPPQNIFVGFVTHGKTKNTFPLLMGWGAGVLPHRGSLQGWECTTSGLIIFLGLGPFGVCLGFFWPTILLHPFKNLPAHDLRWFPPKGAQLAKKKGLGSFFLLGFGPTKKFVSFLFGGGGGGGHFVGGGVEIPPPQSPPTCNFRFLFFFLFGPWGCKKKNPTPTPQNHPHPHQKKPEKKGGRFPGFWPPWLGPPQMGGILG